MKPDPEVEAMQLYYDRIKKVHDNSKEVQTKHIRKGMAAVLRQTADIFSDAESESSVGSDPVPSEDNLDIEEIEKVLPVQEDPDLATKLKIQKTLKATEEKLAAQKEAALALKRKSTLQEVKRKPVKIGNQKEKKKKKEDEDGEADDEMEPKEQEEEKDKVEELKKEQDGTIVHKKKRKKNVETRDVYTQTDRSDYMLIKQR